MSIFDIDSVEKIIGYTFNDKMLLRQCFTHSSYANEHCQNDNELLEFFGDAIIQFVVTEYLYKNLSGDEGDLTVKRAELVSRTPLLESVEKLGLDEHILLSSGKRKYVTHGEKLFSSVYEAVVAGIYIDGGLAEATKFIKNTIIKDFEEKSKNIKKVKITSEVKSEFQEYIQKNHLGEISYELIWKKGPDHSPEFRVAVLLNGKKLAEGVARSKKGAQTKAASQALEKLRKGGNVK